MKPVIVALELGYLAFVIVGATFAWIGGPYKSILFGGAIIALFGRRMFWPLIRPSFCKHPTYTRATHKCPDCQTIRVGRTCDRCGRFEWD